MGDEDINTVDNSSENPTLKPPSEENQSDTPFISPNNEGSIKSKKRMPPKEFIENIGSFATMDKDKLHKIAVMGGKAGGAVTGGHYTRCINCEVRSTCRRAFEESNKEGWEDKESRCVYEMEGRQSIRANNLKEYKAFVSSDPVDLLAKIQTVYAQLENEVQKDLSYTKLTNLLYMLMNIYRLKFGEKAFVMHAHKDLDNKATLDVKALMKEMREEAAKDKAIDIDPHPVPKNAEQDPS